MGWNVTLILPCHASLSRVPYTVAPSVFSSVDMFYAITAAAREGHHFIYTIYLCIVDSYIAKLNDVL